MLSITYILFKHEGKHVWFLPSIEHGKYKLEERWIKRQNADIVRLYGGGDHQTERLAEHK